MIKIVIFDFDDTLYSDKNPKPWRDYCLNAIEFFLQKRSDYQQIMDEVLTRSFSDNQLIAFLKNYDVREEIINDYFKTHQVEDGTFDNCTIVSDESLASFANHFKLFIVSNSKKESVVKNMSILNINPRYFIDIISNTETSKTHAYQDIIKKHNISLEELLVIGNSYNSDILPALEIGANGRVVRSANFIFNDFFDDNCNLKC